ncbi:MAG: glycosyltransferase [Bryobacteraceae bacterium]
MTDSPLASCIMPTYNRRRFVPQAIRYFQRQNYEHKELIVLDDGDDSVADLIPSDPRIRYVRLPQRLSVGAKRNIACEQAQGEVILHWDDDDWHAPHRIGYQVDFLLQQQADVCGVHQVHFYDCTDHSAWLYVYPIQDRFWLYGNSLCYRRAFWESHRFEDVDIGEDTRFIWTAPASRMLPLPDTDFHVSIIHGNNISARQGGGPLWSPAHPDRLRGLLGEDWSFYREEPAPAAPRIEIDTPQRDWQMVHAHNSDLSLPEFAAFADGVHLPRMRTWELPWALSAARLDNTMTVLDCTINPCGFADRLTNLYPHVLYRHVNPVRNGSFELPSGVPDGAFDRIFCINTLEHLLRPQREALIANLARKLKPGGQLIITCDYYFDSLWSRPEPLHAGLVRPDRSEVFMGFNKVGFTHLAELGRPHDLHPASAIPADPQESDARLFLHPLPYPHGCIGAVFYKGEIAPVHRSMRIVLSLLTWNTCSVSMESLQAYLHEAAMLQRLGHQPFLCVCDNGSDDGTAETLRQMDSTIRFPHRFILNTANRGNSVARNQIIDYALEEASDYVLFLDGDIEIVPFSSYAMARYMETNGHCLGSIGAYSGCQTPHRAHAASVLYSINHLPAQDTKIVAWTQYGMFRTAMFREGIRFDEEGPFGGPGWGFEDNDLAYQMEMKGFRNRYFTGMTYLHRNLRSSVVNLRRQGLDPNALCQSRRQYVLDKWEPVEAINGSPLQHVRDFRQYI